MFSHGQSCLRIIQDGLDEPGIVEEQSTMLAYRVISNSICKLCCSEEDGSLL
jgi:hypothetical protein